MTKTSVTILAADDGSEFNLTVTPGQIALQLRDSAQDVAYAALTLAEAHSLATALIEAIETESAGGTR